MKTLLMSLFVVLISTPVFAEDAKVVAISGASSTFTDPRDGILHVFGGSVLNPNKQCKDTTCDTCDGTGSQFVPCNKSAISPNVVLRVEVSIPGWMKVGPGTTVALEIGARQPVDAKSGYTDDTAWVETTWSNICASGGDATCASSFLADAALIVTGPNHQASNFDFKIILSAVDAAASNAFFEPCLDGVGGNFGDGFCAWSAYPGDHKVYADDLTIAGSSNNTPFGGARWSAVAFFYETDRGEGAATTLRKIRNNSPAHILAYDPTFAVPSVDPRLIDLKNGNRYCFVMANVDQAGNIWKAAPVWDSTAYTPAQLEKFCATPLPVNGIIIH